MKKSTMIAAVFAASAFSALAADVYSSNIVGYTKLSAFGGSGEDYTMLACPFAPVGGGDVAIKNLFKDNSVFLAGGAENVADTIKIWDGTTYLTYIYSNDADPYAWTSDQDSFTETEDTIPAGSAFWLYRRGAAIPAMLTAGEVIQTNVTVTVNGGGIEVYTQVGNPFVAPLPIKSISAPDFVAGGAENVADTIKVWNGTTYVTYIYSNDVDPSAWTSDQDSFTETEDTIPVGGGFWIYRRGDATTATLPVPY